MNRMSTTGPAAALPQPSDTTLPLVVGTTSTLWSIALITYVLRMYTRYWPYPNLGWDDLAISLAMAITTANWGCNIGVQFVTGGRHIQYITRAQLETTAQLAFINMLFWIWSLTVMKVSVALMLLRIKQSPRWKMGIWSLIVVLLLIGIGGTLAHFLQCSPITANWTVILRFSGRHCWAPEIQEMVTYLVSALFAATDIVCALLPLFFIVKINRPIRERVVLFLLMAMGLLACACGLIKTFLVKGVLQSRDPIFEGASVGIWSYSEEYIGITAANIPCLKSLLEAVYHKLGGHITNTTNSSAKYSSSSYGLDSFSPPNQNDYTLTSLNQIYKTNIARVCVEDNPASYHASLEESFLTPKRLETSSESQEYMLVKMKGTGMSGHGLALNPLMDGERGLTTRQVTINGKRVDRYDPRR